MNNADDARKNEKGGSEGLPSESGEWRSLEPFEVVAFGAPQWTVAERLLVRIDHWNLNVTGWFDRDGTLYPVFYLTGIVTSHPRLPDGTFVKTTAITACRGKIAYTASGRFYVLSAHPDRQYIEARSSFDRDNPLSGLKFKN